LNKRDFWLIVTQKRNDDDQEERQRREGHSRHSPGYPAAIFRRREDESSIAELCRKEGINQNLYYRWSKEFLEAGKKRLAGDTAREANSDEVKGLRREAAQLKEALAETVLENRLLKKSTYGAGGDDT
jgi:transposase-like protein